MKWVDAPAVWRSSSWHARTFVSPCVVFCPSRRIVNVVVASYRVVMSRIISRLRSYHKEIHIYIYIYIYILVPTVGRQSSEGINMPAVRPSGRPTTPPLSTSS